MRWWAALRIRTEAGARPLASEGREDRATHCHAELGSGLGARRLPRPSGSDRRARRNCCPPAAAAFGPGDPGALRLAKGLRRSRARHLQLDVTGWMLSLGRKPLNAISAGSARRVDVEASAQCPAAHCRAARLSQRSRSRLAALLQSAVNRTEAQLRARFKPLVDRALDQVKLMPANPPENVARKKLVEEILDRVVERGFLSNGRPARFGVAQ